MMLKLWRHGKIISALLIVALTSLFVILKTDVVTANPGGGAGTGGGSGSGAANCMSNALYTPCPLVDYYDKYGQYQVNWDQSGVYGGGASWRIFRAVDGVWGLDDSEEYGTVPYNRILIGRYKQAAIDKCRDFGWIVSYGWDGMHGSVAGYGDFDFQIGPASKVLNGVSQAINDEGVYYNNHDAATSGYSNNTRISLGYAVELYKKYLEDMGKSSEGVTSIPDEYGYFCSSSEDTRKSFQGRASVSEGAWESSTNNASTNWTTKDNKTAKITMKSPNDGVSTRVFLKLRTKTGSGDTYYWTKTNDGSWSSRKTLEPAEDNGTHILKNGSQAGIWQTVKPGETHCRYLKFRPYGSLADTATRTIGACSTAEVTTFEGSTSVSGAVSGETGYGSSNTTKNVSMNCSPSSGCKIKFSHKIKSSKNKGSTKYHIERTSNWKDKVGSGTIVGNTTFTATLAGAEKGYEGTDLTLYPGMKVCEKIVFNKDNDSTKETGDANREVCVHATGNARDTDDETFLNIKVRNNDVNNYNAYQKEVYAKPGDEVEFQPSYNPSLQYAYNLTPDYMKINGGSETDNRTTKNILGELFNKKKGNLSNWNNGFGVNSENFGSSSFSYGYAWGVADTTPRTESPNRHTVSSSEVGLVVKEKAETNVDVSAGKNNKTTPGQVTFSYANNKFVSDVKTNTVKSEANVKVPYNFKTGIDIELTGDTRVKVDGENEMPAFSAGGTGRLDINVEIQPKSNSKTTNGEDEKYATKSSSKLRLVVFVPADSNNLPGADEEYGNYNSALCDKYRASSKNGKCYEITTNNAVDEVFNQDGITVAQAKELSEKGMTGIKRTSNNLTSFNVSDLDAGTNVCVAAAVYPSTSGVDENLDPNGDGKWNISTPKCFVVYKKPSLQVWGGDVFSAGKLNTPVASKNNVAGFSDQGYEYDVKEKGKVALFGSFGELALISVGKVEGFSSGAATGYGGNNGNGSLTPSVQGDLSGHQSPFGGYTGDSSSFCERSRLTFANSNSKDELNCKFSAPGLNDSGGSSANTDKTSLVSTFINMSEAEANGKGVTVKKLTGDYKISDDENIVNGNGGAYMFIEKGHTNVVYAKNGDTARDVIIDRNIIYDDGYASLKDVPKMIIYAGNIKISCGVERVDAVLIAENDVDTCYDSSDMNSSDNSRQLVINGTVIANNLKANRTYGAATGSNSIVPAEIINYDTTLYLWGAKKADVTETGKLDTSYKRELAPRR